MSIVNSLNIRLIIQIVFLKLEIGWNIFFVKNFKKLYKVYKIGVFEKYKCGADSEI